MTDDEFVVTIRGHDKSAQIRSFYRQLDEWHSSRQTSGVPESSEEINESSDVHAELSSGRSDDVGETDSEVRPSDGDGEPDNQGDSELPTERSGEEADEGASDDPDPTPVTAGGSDEQSTSNQRVQQESQRPANVEWSSQFHFPHGQGRFRDQLD